MYKKLFVVSVVCSVLVSCTEKEILNGDRKALVLSKTEKAMEHVYSDIEIEEELAKTSQWTQPYSNSSHYYLPSKFTGIMNEMWEFNLDYPNSKNNIHAASPIIADGKVFAIDAGGIVYALDSETGKLIWKMSTTIIGKDGQIGGALAYHNGKLIVTSSFAECFSLDANTGDVLWRIKLSSACKGDGITVVDNTAYVSCNNNTLNAIDINNGNILWTHSGMASTISEFGSASVAVNNGMVYVAYSTGEIFALLKDTGMLVWESAISKFSITYAAHSVPHVRACPIVANDILYISSANQQTFAMDAMTGKKLWVKDIGSCQTPIVSGSCIFVFNGNSELVCLDKDLGGKYWTCKLDAKGSSRWYGMNLMKNHIAVTSMTGTVSFIEIATGKIVQSTNTGKNVLVNPVLVNDMMVILSEGKIAAYK